MTFPRATYRLQLRAGFGFNEAAALAPYLGRLGVSHVYLSPFFKARPGSTHGYDITDHSKLNPELGTEAEFLAMLAAFARENLGRIIDFVPNHMGVGGADNPLWLDVLEWGPGSDYAGWFDIDWTAEGGRGKLLAPVLGAQYGEELRRGALELRLEEDGSFAIWAYGEHKLPICPLTYPRILGHDNDALDQMSDFFVDLEQWRPQITARARALKAELAALLERDADARESVTTQVARLNGDWRQLHELISEQFWRVAFFRVAGDEINYRRFFNINDLAGLRVELAPVFKHAHARVFRMLEDREIDGLRIDHIDGLFDPKTYLRRLRAEVFRSYYLVVEKILSPHEFLRADWPVEGTTGYDYLNLSLGLLVDTAAEEAFTETYASFAGKVDDFDEIARLGKIRIMENEMASELHSLGRAAARLARQSSMTADLTRSLLQRAIKQLIANFPIYRTYVDLDGAPDESDRRDIAWAITRARRADPDIHGSAFDFLQNLLLAQTAALEIGRSAALRVAMKFQQLSGPVMAKGVEDTVFYRYNRFVALNEVGGSPERFGLTPWGFHKANAWRAEHWPHAMLATTTHDTKRGEDARARLAVLSEFPEEWRRRVVAWNRILRARRGDVEGKGPPDRNDEYLFYQMLLGAWPMDMLENPSAEALEVFSARLHDALEKSLRESKQNSNWTSPNVEYEEATQALAREALRPEAKNFLDEFLPFAGRVARLGVQNSLVQTALKLTAPGVPDIYQGCESWDFSLVDPDNRRAIDFAKNQAALAELAPRFEVLEERRHLFEALLENWSDGVVKIATTALILTYRRENADFFAHADYQPITITGEQSHWALGFVRAYGERRLAVVVARFPALREAEPDWRAYAKLPEGRWRNILDNGRVETEATVSSWLGALPFAILEERGL
jgi:(1->4)-alpha-D-glucan 1-alpha-D-glucosylmutase